MQINPLYFFIFLGFVLYFYNQIIKRYHLLPDEFKELESKYIPKLLKRDWEKTWFLQSESNRKYRIKAIPFIFLGTFILILLQLSNMNINTILNLIKNVIVFGAIGMCFIDIYYYIKVYRKYRVLYSNLDIQSGKAVLNFIIMQCIVFVIEAALLLFIFKFK